MGVADWTCSVGGSNGTVRIVGEAGARAVAVACSVGMGGRSGLAGKRRDTGRDVMTAG